MYLERIHHCKLPISLYVKNMEIYQNITIHLKTFGSENIAHIEGDMNLLNRCLMNKDIKTLIESIHCDKQYPEKHKNGVDGNFCRW